MDLSDKTYFASPQRSSDAEITKDHSVFVSGKPFIEILGAVSGIVMVLNKNRQIIYANDQCLQTLGADSPDKVLGKRPGEALGCIHAADMPAGCGTSESCSVCGAVNTIIESQKTAGKTSGETRITTRPGEFLMGWDLMVTSSPVNIEGNEFYVFSIADISNEKRRQNLEKIFFHDILNSAGSLNGLISILKEINDPEETMKLLNVSEEVSKGLIEEILHHKQIRSAENGDLMVTLDLEQPFELLKLAAGKMEHHPVAEGKTISVENHSGSAIIETDRVLLQRVLINMLKNALEATSPGGTVEAAAVKQDDKVSFLVKNKAVIPREGQMQIFQRSFSTKGTGRGIGTYSIKLLTENYLKGRAGFRSNEEEGTVFFVDLPVYASPGIIK